MKLLKLTELAVIAKQQQVKQVLALTEITVSVTLQTPITESVPYALQLMTKF